MIGCAVADAPPPPLTEVYHGWVATTVDEKGFDIPHGLSLSPAGELTVLALAVPPEQAYQVMFRQWETGAAEMIFALDRFAKAGQGTTLGDLLAGFYCTRQDPPRPFIIEYQHAPRIVKPIEWGNIFWNAALLSEINAALRGHLGISRW